MFCVYVHFFDMKTKKNEIKKMGRPGFEPTILRIWSYSD